MDGGADAVLCGALEGSTGSDRQGLSNSEFEISSSVLLSNSSVASLASGTPAFEERLRTDALLTGATFGIFDAFHKSIARFLLSGLNRRNKSFVISGSSSG